MQKQNQIKILLLQSLKNYSHWISNSTEMSSAILTVHIIQETFLNSNKLILELALVFFFTIGFTALPHTVGEIKRLT